MNFQLVVTPLREDRISMYYRMKIPTTYDCETFTIAQQMAHLIFDLYQFRELPLFHEEWPGEYSFEGEGFLVEIKKI